MWASIPSLLLLLFAPNFVESLLVVPSSPQCAALCGNTLDATSGAEMTCHDGEYATSTYGATFEACIACELSSTYYDTVDKQADLQWAIYNLRYALSWCLFGFDNNTKVASTPCLTSFSCAPLQNAVEYASLNLNESTYSYCPLFNSSQNTISSCSECLRETGNEYYLSNFLTVLNAACIQQPVLGVTLSLQGSVFSSTAVNITSPSAISISYNAPKTNGLDLGARVGISVGVILAVLVIMGCCIVWRGKRRRRAILIQHQRASGYADWQAQNSTHRQGTPYVGPKPPNSPFFDSPQSQRPFTRTLSWDHNRSPESAHAEQAYFSPYNSNYTSPTNAVDRATHAGSWPSDHKDFSPGMQLEKSLPWARENIEMADMDMKESKGPQWQQSPPPVLQHPGLGREGHLTDLEIKEAPPNVI